ncbi:ribulose-phosphate 3-epimerase [Mycolicibacterium sp. BK556]|uniref:ribulose-phosphate 3-epimerase n=1 Tax=unclassified Mycolicibacterium TaxID=2636767 RepID=UPI00161763FF|nr:MULTISPECIES: ribulose-phosphate 3-epimerase [unclassified Mycolicibacterium]MBB3606288.1 ribulose-phosphate 3-epimerase [Mycolicibacterium sp. BK556]MBB3632867.1 ribulose-phosphate 3-epimerase [Mycolicibacterium sp. BK607]
MTVKTTSAPKLVASVLPADFAELGRDVEQIDQAGIDRIQWDVMDGSFVPNLTFGPDVIAANRGRTPIGFEAHLMVDDPDPMLHRWVDAGCQIVIVHAEACRHLHRTLSHIRDLGALAGVALNPATPLEAVVNVLDVTDLLLVMTVNPGFGGQRYLADMEPKIAAARAEIELRGLDIELEVDGGISTATIGAAAAAGADVFCTGSALFSGPGTMNERAREMRSAATQRLALR